MKKVFLLLLVATLFGCSNVKVYKATSEEKLICKENMDTIINHLSEGWVVVDSFYNTEKYYSVTHKDGTRDDFYHWILISRVSVILESSEESTAANIVAQVFLRSSIRKIIVPPYQRSAL